MCESNILDLMVESYVCCRTSRCPFRNWKLLRPLVRLTRERLGTGNKLYKFYLDCMKKKLCCMRIAWQR